MPTFETAALLLKQMSINKQCGLAKHSDKKHLCSTSYGWFHHTGLYTDQTRNGVILNQHMENCEGVFSSFQSCLAISD